MSVARSGAPIDRSGWPYCISGLSADGSCPQAEPNLYLQPRARREPSPKIEFVFSASPETIRSEPPEFELLRTVANLQDLAVCAQNNPDAFYSRAGFFAAPVPPNSSVGTKSCCLRSTASQIGNDLPCHRQRGAVAITSLHFFFVDQGQFMALSRGQFRGLHQHVLNVFVALLGNGCSQHLIGRALLRSAQSAITDGQFDRSEARDIADLQSPGQLR